VILAGLEAYIPYSSLRSSSNCKPWFDDACSEAILARNRAYQSWKNNPTPLTHSNFISLRNRAHSIISKTKDRFIKNKCNNLVNNPSSKSFWSLSKQITRNFAHSSFPPLFHSDGTVASSPLEKANIFAHKFASNSSVDDSGIPHPQAFPLTEPTLPSFFLSTGTVQRALALLDVGKAYGPDGVPPLVLRQCSGCLAPALTKLFRLILKTKIFPSCWKHAVVQPVFKKGDPSDPSNYRPIAITSTISKVFESLINSKLSTHLENHHLLSDHQYGFRSSRSFKMEKCIMHSVSDSHRLKLH